jgi:hypothetical protein
MEKLRIVALIFDSVGLAGSCVMKLNAMHTGNNIQSQQADALIERGIKSVKRDLGL